MPKKHHSPKSKPEFDQALLDLARVTRVVRGGRRFRFRATIVIGNRKGKVALGVAKGSDVSDAISKAFNKARKDLVTVTIVNGTIPHEVRYKYKSARVILKPAKKGRGIIAGGALRPVAELAGITDLTAKIVGHGGKITNAMAAIKALTTFKKGRVQQTEKKEQASGNETIKEQHADSRVSKK